MMMALGIGGSVSGCGVDDSGASAGVGGCLLKDIG